jgi:hypothetical protein
MLTGLKMHYPNRKFVYGLAKVNMCSTETCRKREFNGLSKYKPEVCMGLTLKDNVYSVTSECASEVNRLSSIYKQDCNEYFSDMLGLGGACDTMLPNTKPLSDEGSGSDPGPSDMDHRKEDGDESSGEVLSAYDDWVTCYNDTTCKKSVKQYIQISNTFLQKLSNNKEKNVRNQPCVQWVLKGVKTESCTVDFEKLGISHPKDV